MKKIYIKFEKHSGGYFVYEFVGVKGFRDWYLDRYSYKTGVFLPSNATIGDICKALREDYLRCLADDYGLSHEEVLTVANTLGQDEDFDGLVLFFNVV